MQSRNSLPSDNEVDTFVGYDFGDRLTFTVGSSYIVGTSQKLNQVRSSDWQEDCTWVIPRASASRKSSS